MHCKIIIASIMICIMFFQSTVMAKDVQLELNKQFLSNAAEEIKDDVSDYLESEESVTNLHWFLYNNYSYERNMKWSNENELFDLGRTFAAHYVPINVAAMYEDCGGYYLYEIIHYADRNEFGSLLSENVDWQVPVCLGSHDITTMWLTKDINSGEFSLHGAERAKGYEFDVSGFLERIQTLNITGALNNIESVKIVRHSSVLFLYVKADEQEYAIPYVCGVERIPYPGYDYRTLRFELNEGELYTVAELYRAILDQLKAHRDALLKETPLYQIPLELGQIPMEKYYEGLESGKVLATAGEMAEKLQAVGLMKGSDDGLKVQSGLTRAEGLTMLLRMTGQETKANSTTLKNKFEDMDDSHWANKMVAYAYDKGLVQGTSETEFSPEDNLSAAQFMVMLLRVMGYNELDGETLSLDNAKAFGEKVGFKTDFADVKNLKRGQMAIIASRALNITCKDGKTVAEKLKDSGVLTQEQYETVSSPDFYFVPFK